MHKVIAGEVCGPAHLAMAETKMVKSYGRKTGEFPKVVHIAVFEHENGLITEWDGERWTVVKPGK